MTADPKLERLIRVLERRGRKGFLFLRSAEGSQVRAMPSGSKPSTPEQFVEWWNAADEARRADWFAAMIHDRATAARCFLMDHENAEWQAYLAGWRAAEDGWIEPERVVRACYAMWRKGGAA